MDLAMAIRADNEDVVEVVFAAFAARDDSVAIKGGVVLFSADAAGSGDLLVGFLIEFAWHLSIRSGQEPKYNS